WLGAILAQRRTARSTEHHQFGIVRAKRSALPLRFKENAEESQAEPESCNEDLSTVRFIHAHTPIPDSDSPRGESWRGRSIAHDWFYCTRVRSARLAVATHF